MHSLRFDPDGIDLKQGEIITPAHPAFLMLYADYVDSPHPLMIPAFVSDASPSSAPADTLLGAFAMEQTLSRSAAFKLKEDRQPNGDLQLRPERTPLAQAANMPELFNQLLQSPWETIYTLGRDPLPREVPDVSKIAPKGARIVVRVRNNARLGWPSYEYFQVQSIELLVPAIPISKTAAVPATLTSQQKPNRGRPRTAEWRTWSLDDVIDLLSEARRCATRNIDDPGIGDIIAASGYPRETIRNALKPYGHTPTSILPLLHD